jgi:DNA-binding NarL/FixJ family response regulator
VRADSTTSRGDVIERFRILLVDVSRLVGEMVEGAVVRTNDMGVVGTTSLDELLDTARASEPDVVIVGIDAHNGLPDECVDLLLERPRVKVLAIEERAGHARLYELRPERVEIGDVSPEEVVESIRAAVLRPSPF